MRFLSKTLDYENKKIAKGKFYGNVGMSSKFL